VARKPPSLGHTVAASIPVAGVTALVMADALALSRGHVVVAVGATGGVGSSFVQLAAGRGARVVAVCRGENADYGRRLGAADVIDYTEGDVAEAVRSRYPDGIDAIADMHGDREGVARLAEQVRSGGHVASAVGAADPAALAKRGIEATNIMGTVTTASLESLAAMLERGEIVGPEIRSFALDDAGEALAALATGHVRGKLVVIPG
jgi:NADPH:quinone reductase-like Zn-dependent oxidoreductase